MRLYYGIVDRHGTIRLTHRTLEQTRETIAALGQKFPDAAPFRLTTLTPLDDVADDLDSATLTLPDDTFATEVVCSIARTLRGIAQGDKRSVDVIYVAHDTVMS
jgi:hypothetical protein